VRHAVQSDTFHQAQALRPCITDPTWSSSGRP
jgi:hypothetical protein